MWYIGRTNLTIRINRPKTVGDESSPISMNMHERKMARPSKKLAPLTAASYERPRNYEAEMQAAGNGFVQGVCHMH